MKSNKVSIVLATILALVTGALVMAYTVGADKRALQGATTVDVYVATAALPVGKSLQEALDGNLVKLQHFPESAVPADAIKSIDDTNSALVATNSIGVGQMLQAAYFAASTSVANGLQVPEGQVALTIKMEDAAHLGTFLTPGSEVVLYDTYQVQGVNQTAEYTGILLQKVLVLAVGSSVTSTDQDTKTAALVTIAVTPKESVKVVQAVQTGKVYFSLLGNNVDASGTSIASTNNLFKK